MKGRISVLSHSAFYRITSSLTDECQHESARINTSQHESKTNQHDSHTSQHESTRVRHESTRINTSPTRVNYTKKLSRFIVVLVGNV